MADGIRIACVQMLSGTEPAGNLAAVVAQTRRAAEAGARLVVFPEGTMCRFGVPLTPVAEPIDGRWADGVRAVAEETRVTVLAGMFTPAPDGRVTNTVLATGGGVEARYDKIHLFDAFGFAESAGVAPGHRPTVIDVDGVGVGITLCYDIRFSGLYTALADRGAQLITVSASWGAGPGKLDQWTLLARARALDSTCFIAACGQADPGPELAAAAAAPTGVGGSLVVSPLGEVLTAAGPDPHLLLCDVDTGILPRIRATLPVLANRVELTDRAESRR